MDVYATIPFDLTATVTRDPNPVIPVLPLTYRWDQLSKNLPATIANAGSPTVTIIAPVAGRYVFSCAVDDGHVTNRQNKVIQVLPYFTSTQSYTAQCGVYTTGIAVTREASATSIVSQEDADSKALAAATAAANAALRCDPNMEGFTGWRLVAPDFSDYAGIKNATFSLTLRIATLTRGSALKPELITPVAAQTFKAGDLENHIIDLSSYLFANPGSRTFYLWPVLTLTLDDTTIVRQLPSNAFSLDYAAPVGSILGTTVRFRDVETAYTNYQGYASAYALTIKETASAAIQMTLNAGNAWDTFSLNLHGWDDKAYGLDPARGYDRLVFSVLTGTPAEPLRDTVLDVREPAYNLNDPYDFAVNRLSYTPFFEGSESSVSFILRRANANADGSLSYDSKESGFRFESSLNYYDYTTPTLTLPGAKIAPLAQNDAGSVVPASNVTATIAPFPGNPAIVSFSIPRFTLSSFKWREPGDIYTDVVIIIISGTPKNPTGIKNEYAFTLGDPAVLDGPENIFLPLAEFNTLLDPFHFQPFTAVFFSAVPHDTKTVNPPMVIGNYLVYPDSFPILNNNRVVNGIPTYEISDFVGFEPYPASVKGAVTFSGVFAYAETIYNLRVNNGIAFLH
jgi:hypothetical protein